MKVSRRFTHKTDYAAQRTVQGIARNPVSCAICDILIVLASKIRKGALKTSAEASEYSRLCHRGCAGHLVDQRGKHPRSGHVDPAGERCIVGRGLVIGQVEPGDGLDDQRGTERGRLHRVDHPVSEVAVVLWADDLFAAVVEGHLPGWYLLEERGDFLDLLRVFHRRKRLHPLGDYR